MKQGQLSNGKWRKRSTVPPWKKMDIKKKRPTDFLAFFCTGSVMSEHMTAYLWGRNSLFHITFRYNKDVENSQGPYQSTLRLYYYRQWLSLVKYSHFIAIRVAFFINKQADMSFFHELYVTIFEITLVHISYYWQLPGVPSCINHLTHGLYPYLCDLGFTGLSINISGQNILLMVGTSSYKVNLHIESKAKKKEVSH